MKEEVFVDKVVVAIAAMVELGIEVHTLEEEASYHFLEEDDIDFVGRGLVPYDHNNLEVVADLDEVVVALDEKVVGMEVGYKQDEYIVAEVEILDDKAMEVVVETRDKVEPYKAADN